MSSSSSAAAESRPTPAPRVRKNPNPQRYPVVDKLMPVAAKPPAYAPPAGDRGVEAAALLISELSLDTPFSRPGNNAYSTFANFTRNGLRLAIKLRNAPVTVSPHHDTFNNFCMDIKLPDDFQGSNLKHLEEAIADGGANWPAVAGLLAKFNGDFTFKSRLYGTGQNTFLSLKLQENLKVVRKATDGSITPAAPDAIVRGMEVDLALSPLLWITEPEDGTPTVGLSYKVVKVMVTDGPASAKADKDEIEIDL